MTELKNIFSFVKKGKKYLSLLSIGAVVAIITPVAYLIGISYYEGYLSAFGVDSNIFNPSIQKIYVYSYYVVGSIFLNIGECFSNGLTIWIYITMLAFVFLFYLIFRFKKCTYDDDILEKIKNNIKTCWNVNNFFKSCRIVFIAFFTVSFLLTSMLSIPLIWWAIPLYAHSEGKKIAFSQINSFMKNGCKKEKDREVNTCTTVIVKDKDGNEEILHEGLLVDIDAKMIALFKKNGTHIFSRKENFILQRKTLLSSNHQKYAASRKKTMDEKDLSGAFISSLTRNNKEIRADRAAAIAEDAELVYKRKIEDLEISIRKMQREQEYMLDLSPTTTQSLILASDFNCEEYVTTDIDLGIKIRQAEITLEIAKQRYNYLFGGK